MISNRLCCSTLGLLTVLACGGAAALQCLWGDACLCLQCPAGHQPSKACAEIQSPSEAASCQSCPVGSFSEALDSDLCRPHLSCELIGREVATPGTVTSDAVCGDCLPGLWSTEASDQSPCVEKHLRAGRLRAGRLRAGRSVAERSSSGSGPVNGTVVRSADQKTADYAVFALVPIFCVMGLLGILICHILKRKGYNCTAEKQAGDEERASPQKHGATGTCVSEDILTEDTISVLVRLITQKKENAAALEELLLEYERKQTSKGSSVKLPTLSPLSTSTSPGLCSHQPHVHTVAGVSGPAHRHGHTCTRCAQSRWPPVLIPPPLKPPPSLILPSLDASVEQQKSPLLAGVCVDTPHTHAGAPITVQGNTDGAQVEARREVTVTSVGRFQVAQIPEHKPHDPRTSTQEQHRSFGITPFSTSSAIRR